MNEWMDGQADGQTDEWILIKLLYSAYAFFPHFYGCLPFSALNGTQEV
jgi:uncharacterized protein (DUF952 family)